MSVRIKRGLQNGRGVVSCGVTDRQIQSGTDAVLWSADRDVRLRRAGVNHRDQGGVAGMGGDAGLVDFR
jgi:hypothetical protein